MRYLSYAVVGALIVVASATMAVAGEVSAQNIVVAKPSMTSQLANGKTYFTIGSRQVCEMTDPSHPLNDASGDCDGACVSEGDGTPTCMGSCTLVDTDGDIAFFTWTGGGAEGTWEMQGGSGKWANASGSGTWQSAAVFVGNMERSSWSGSIEME